MGKIDKDELGLALAQVTDLLELIFSCYGDYKAAAILAQAAQDKVEKICEELGV